MSVWPQAGLHHTIVACALLGIMAQPTSVVTVDRDNIIVNSSCQARVGAAVVRDRDGNGVIHITGNDIAVDFEGATLRGAAAETPPNEYEGVGVRITGTGVTLRNLNVTGFKVAIHAVGAHHLTLEDCNVSDNFRQRLRSTPQREDSSDWLWPHANDNNEWITNYGAGVCIEDSNEVTVRRIRARNVQNGIILDRVNESFIYDNDCSFLSGWGIALWRSNMNHITRNALDFCIRGYSHGVYNRGQDSAGLLMFEQCSDNIIAENSITHGGDGIFAFSGKEALGQVVPEGVEREKQWYRNRGNHLNIILRNDCSYAAAHGVEMTFGFDNSILANRLVGNAICGVWGGYSHRLIIAGNTIESNGELGYGLERGGVNIEHGMGNWVQANQFANNKCGVHLWWDDDKSIESLPWAEANMTNSSRNVIYGNTFSCDELAIHLRASMRTFIIDNTFENVAKEMDADALSQPGIAREFKSQPPLQWNPPKYEAFGAASPVGARSHLAGRDKIIMTEWGPYDWASPLLRLRERLDDANAYGLLGVEHMPAADAISHEGEVTVDVANDRIIVRPAEHDTVAPYTIVVQIGEGKLSASGTITGGTWDVVVFPSPVDPREDVEQWRAASEAKDVLHVAVEEVKLTYGHGGMTELRGLQQRLPSDHFGTIVTRTLTFPAGTWRLRTLSDDGIRVWLDEKLAIDDWTWHAPKEHAHEFTVKNATSIDIRVEHFELDGYAVLTLGIERVK